MEYRPLFLESVSKQTLSNLTTTNAENEPPLGEGRPERVASHTRRIVEEKTGPVPGVAPDDELCPGDNDLLTPESLDRLVTSTELRCTSCRELRHISRITLGYSGWICAHCVRVHQDELGLPPGAGDPGPYTPES